ncbi:MAG: type II CAAX endopeptidase family protein [Anaerolineales bacterium]
MFPWITESPLFSLARRGTRLTHWLAVLPLGLAFIFVSSFGAIPVVLAMLAVYGFENGMPSMQGQPALVSGFWMSLQLISSFAGIFLFLWLWLKFYEKRPFYTLGFEKPGALLQYGRGLLLGAAMFSGAVGLMALFGFVELAEGDPAQTGLAALGGVLLMALGWVVQGAGEEVLTRGWMLPALGARTRPWIGIMVVSLFFALLHGLNPNLSVLAVVNLALFGLFAAFYALREGSLWGICALHSVWNWVQGNLFGFEVSGANAGGGTLLKLVETGPDWFTGGAFGPEGGLAVSLMLVLGIVVLFAWPRPKIDPAL